MKRETNLCADSATIGFAADKASALLVPSAAIRGEWNMLLNPIHPTSPQSNSASPRPLNFDVRMFRL